MRIGIDFDNTIISYDRVFHEAAAEWGYAVGTVAATKTAVRDYLRSLGEEERWIELQGYVYGKKMAHAEAFPGALSFFREAKRRGVELRIISHKTRHPFRGPQYDLHAATRHWLGELGLIDSPEHGIGEGNVFLELSKEAKAERIGQQGCTHFIDDLPEFLEHEAFPSSAIRALFDPGDAYGDQWTGYRVRSWYEFARLVFTE